MKTKVEPTVEKWELQFDSLFVDKKVKQVDTSNSITLYPWKNTHSHQSQEVKDFIRTLLSQSAQEAKAERVAEIENSKIISSIGYRPSKFRGLSAVAIYNMALDDLLASLKQEEKK